MKLKYILVLILGILSFYYSDKLIIYIENKNPLMLKINDEYEKYNLLPVNATIKDDTIIPGKKGREVDIRESYLKMNEFGVFNDTFMVYKYISPEESLNDNLDKYIISSRDINKVAIITNNNEVSNYLKNNNIKHSHIVTNSVKKTELIEYINGHMEINSYKTLDNYLTKNKLNKKICIESINDINYCIKKKYYLVKPSIKINGNSLVSNINKIEGGNFIYIDGNLKNNELDILINHIKKNNLSIEYLSILISE